MWPLIGRPLWSDVVAGRGVKWAPNFGRPPNRVIGQPQNRHVVAHCWAQIGHPKMGGVGRSYRDWRWVQLDARKLGAHTWWTQKG